MKTSTQFLPNTRQFAGIIIMLLAFFNIHASAQTSDSTATSKSKFRFCPAIYFSPETRAGLGVTTFKLFHVGDDNRTSNITATGLYTLNKQTLIEGTTTLFLDQEKWLVKGKVNFKQFPEYFYGIGENASDDNRITTSYSYYNVQGTVYRNLFKGLFLGVQGTYNHYFDVSFNNNSVSDNLPGKNGAKNIGLGASLLYDTRDNVLNARKGMYAEVSEMNFSTSMGSDYSYRAIQLDVRKYFALNEKNTLAWQAVSSIKTGDVPFLQLSYLGGTDMMRGFYSGRYRDKDLIATQIELRHQITEKWGAVAFAGIGNVSDKVKNYDFNNLKHSVGIGARYMLDKKDRMNLRFDAGMGDGQLNFYVALTEAF